MDTYFKMITHTSDSRLVRFYMLALKNELINIYQKYGGFEQITDDITIRCINICTEYFKNTVNLITGNIYRYFEEGGLLL